MGFLFNLVDNFFKSLQKGVADQFYNKVKNTEMHPDVKNALEGMIAYDNQLHDALTKHGYYDVNINSNKSKLKLKNNIYKEVKATFISYYNEILKNDLKVEDFVQYLKLEHNKSDQFCLEFIEQYNDYLSYLNYEKELELKNEEKHKLHNIKKEKEINKSNNLIKKYGEDIALKISKGKYWRGMTKAMLIDSLGHPGDKKEDILKDKVKLKFYYNKERNQLGNWSYNLEVSLEDGIVVGWKDLNIISKRTK